MRHFIYTVPLFIVLSLIAVASSALSSGYSDISNANAGMMRTLDPNDVTATPRPMPVIEFTPINAPPVGGCSHAIYPDWETSPYVLPYAVNETYEVRLSNCSSSFHAQGRGDELAFDFVMDVGTVITASRAGTVIFVEQRGEAREINNLIVIDHGDDTFGEYMHLQLDGALVEVGDFVEQGDPIGLSGVTGLAGYPHLHFIVVRKYWEWPYVGVPVTFSNTAPNPRSLASDTAYTALPYGN